MPAPTFLSLLYADATREQIEEWCRSKTQSYAAGTDGVMCRVLGKYLMGVAHLDFAIAPHLALDGIWEPWITMAIARHVKPGMRCMDVGACYGYYALLMADIVGPTGYVEAWEPVWSSIVRRNADINGLGITVERALMGTGDGVWWFRVPQKPYNAGDIRMVAGQPVTGNEERVHMGTPKPQPMDFIKIDVEGAEADVWKALQGVRNLSHNLTVCMEFTPSKHESASGFLVQIMDDGFQLGTVGHDGVPRTISAAEALTPDTGEFRMLWLTKKEDA